jgi:hypothetical protein
MARDGGLLLGAAAFALSFFAALASFGANFGGAERKASGTSKEPGLVRKSYAGLWVTGDGYIRHELLPNGRYVEARGTREKAYEGQYRITGDHIDYKDDTGFVADGDFKDGILYHAGMVFYRRDQPFR